MTIREQIIRELLNLPESVLQELLEHAQALRRMNGREARDTALASEEALSADWLRSEEDEAWSDL